MQAALRATLLAVREELSTTADAMEALRTQAALDKVREAWYCSVSFYTSSSSALPGTLVLLMRARVTMKLAGARPCCVGGAAGSDAATPRA